MEICLYFADKNKEIVVAVFTLFLGYETEYSPFFQYIRQGLFAEIHSFVIFAP